MKSKIHKLKYINKIGVSKTIKTTNRTILSLLLALVIFSSCSSDDDVVKTTRTEVNIPDTNFEQALIDLGIDTDGLNGSILVEDAEAVITLDVGNKNIDDLQGIEAFLNLKTLKCVDNNLTNLDLGANTKLFQLFASNNQLTHVNLQNSAELFYVNVSNNQLTSFDTSNLTALGSLFCFSNAIEALDLSSNNALTTINCHSNSLTSLNVKNGNNINMSNFNTRSNPNLYCVQVDDFTFSNANWSDGIDGTTGFGEDCN